MTPKPTGRGGPNRGQGRKPREISREAITVKLEPHDAARLRALCQSKGVSQAAWIAGKIRRARE